MTDEWDTLFDEEPEAEVEPVKKAPETTSKPSKGLMDYSSIPGEVVNYAKIHEPSIVKMMSAYEDITGGKSIREDKLKIAQELIYILISLYHKLETKKKNKKRGKK